MAMTYEEYYELTERTGWRVTELDWDALLRERDAGQVSDFDCQALCGTAVIEHGVPHYSEVWSLVDRLREHWQLWQFVTLWTGEEHRHSYVLKKTCDVLGITPRIDADLARVRDFRFADMHKRSCATDCYRTVPGMLAYTVIQELSTHKFYGIAAKRTSSPFLKRLFTLISGDEMRHHVYYRDTLKAHYRDCADADREWFCDQAFHAARSFKMPHLIYDVQTAFFEDGDWTIGTLGKMAFKAQLARCFSFDTRLLARLASAKVDSEILAARRQSVTTAT
jgi:hypothetical protein